MDGNIRSTKRRTLWQILTGKPPSYLSPDEYRKRYKKATGIDLRPQETPLPPGMARPIRDLSAEDYEQLTGIRLQPVRGAWWAKYKDPRDVPPGMRPILLHPKGPQINGIKARWLHVKSIGKPWWVVVAALWGMFWGADEIIAKWGSSDVRAFWDTYTSRLHFDWKIGVVGFLAIFALMLIEGSFRHHRQTLAAYEEALVAAEDQHCEQLRSSLAAAKEEDRQALASALSTAEAKYREELAAARQKKVQRDWAGDWKELADQFRGLVTHRIFAQWMRLSDGQSWDITGGGQEAVRRIESLCKHAGDLLLASPKISQTLAPELLSCPAARDRWLFYLKARPGAFRQDIGPGVETLPTGERINLLFGLIPDLPEIAANACMECAGREY